ncbi:MAG TPA: tetratricopeptide repeat protein, partial [Streptosporangiaceae bacterium]
ALAPRAASDPDRLAELVALCGHLPLAVSLLARLFARHRAWSMADLIAQTRARLLTVTAENRTVAAAFELSYQDLSPERQRFFRCLGLHPGREIDAYAAAALTGLSPDEVTGHLDALHRDRLVEEPAPHRYGMHDLIGQYARSLAAAENADQRNQAAGRLLDYYQQTAEAADVYLTRYARAAAARPALAVTAAPALPDLDRALAWMTAERASLLACIDDAAARHDHGRVIALTAAIASHLRSDGPWPLAIRLHTSAVRAAQHLDDRFGEASALNDLGDMWLVTGDYRQATGVLEQALDISRSIGDELGEANALLILGTVRKLTGERLAAAAALEQALDIYRRIGSRLGEANALANLGDVRREANEYAAAADALGQALNICRDTGDRSGEANSLFYLAVVRHATDDMPGATALLNQALAIYRRIGSRLGEANALYSLGDAQRLTGDPAGAAEVLQKALAIYRRIGSRLGEANALYSLGDAQRLTGDPAGAAEMLQQALAIYRDIGDQLGEANILCRLADAWLVAGDIPGAAAMLEKALPIYRHIGERPGETAALNQTGAVHLARGNPQLARTCHLSALELAR